MGSLDVLNKDGQITMSKCFCCRNNDGMLSKTEVLESQGVFVASQVGDFQIKMEIIFLFKKEMIPL